MLNFKLVNDLSQYEQTGPVPISAIFRGHEHQYATDYTDSVIDFNPRTAVLDDSKVGDFNFNLISSFPLNKNLILDSENMSNSFPNSSSFAYLTTQTEDESVLFTDPYYK